MFSWSKILFRFNWLEIEQDLSYSPNAFFYLQTQGFFNLDSLFSPLPQISRVGLLGKIPILNEGLFHSLGFHQISEALVVGKRVGLSQDSFPEKFSLCRGASRIFGALTVFLTNLCQMMKKMRCAGKPSHSLRKSVAIGKDFDLHFWLLKTCPFF